MLPTILNNLIVTQTQKEILDITQANQLIEIPFSRSYYSCNYKGQVATSFKYSTQMQDLVQNIRSGFEESYLLNAGYLLNTFMADPVQIEETMDFYQALELAHSLDNFYGMLLFDPKSKEVINPFHPQVALELTEYDKYFDFAIRKYKVIFYQIKEQYLQNLKLLNFNADMNNEARWIQLIDLIFGAYNNKLRNIYLDSYITNNQELKENFETIFPTVGSLLFPDENTYNYTQKISGKINFGSDDPIYTLIPHQILSLGTYVPYYGVSLITNYFNMTHRSLKSLHISPMLSCNINTDNIMANTMRLDITDPQANEYYSDDMLNHFYLIRERNLQDSLRQTFSVCTGYFKQMSIEGLFCLNHSNLGSPLSTKTLLSGWYDWSLFCIKVSKEIYKEAQWIKQ